jgi:hypothetical protein
MGTGTQWKPLRAQFSVLMTVFLVAREWGVGVPPEMFKVFDDLF